MLMLTNPREISIYVPVEMLLLLRLFTPFVFQGMAPEIYRLVLRFQSSELIHSLLISRTVFRQTSSWIYIPSFMFFSLYADLSTLLRSCSDDSVAMIGRGFGPEPPADCRGFPTLKAATEQHWVPVCLMMLSTLKRSCSWFSLSFSLMFMILMFLLRLLLSSTST